MFVARIHEYIGVWASVYGVELGMSCSMPVTVHRSGGQDLPPPLILFPFSSSSFYPCSIWYTCNGGSRPRAP
jgi:hypothetical protein